MTVAIPINTSWTFDSLINFREYPEYAYKNSHAFTVKTVQHSGNNIIGVELVNPWDSKKPFILDIKKFLQLVVQYSFASYNPRKFDLSYNSNNEINASRSGYKDDDLPILNQWISGLTGIRGEPILRNEKWRYYLLSHGISDTYLWTWFTQWIIDRSIEKLHEWPWTFKKWRKSKVEVYLDNSINNQNIDNPDIAAVILSQQTYLFRPYKQWTIDYTINFWKHMINFGKKNPFSDMYQGEKNDIFRLTLYPSFFANYVNQLMSLARKNQIFNRFGSKFYINAKWYIIYGNSLLSSFWLSSNKTEWDDLEELWIDKNDIETRKKIVDLLNAVIKSK